MPTTNFDLPLYDGDDTAALDVLLNGQSNAIDSALLNLIGYRRGNTAAREAATAGTPAGVRWYDTTKGHAYIHNGTTWVGENLVQSGSVVVNGTGGRHGYATVTFPKPYASAPDVISSSVSVSGASLISMVTATTETTASVRLTISEPRETFSDSYTLRWIAVGRVA